MRIQPTNIQVLLGTLRAHRLVTDLVFPDVSRDSELPIWGDFDLKLNGYLSSIDAEFADPSTFSSCDPAVSLDQSPPTEYHNLPWLLLTASRMSHGRRTLTPAGPLTFSPKTLCSNSIGGTWGRDIPGIQDQPLLFIGASLELVYFRCQHLSYFNLGCRFTEINAPVTTFSGVEDPGLCHRCFAIRIYNAISQTRLLPLDERISSNVVIDCRSGNQPCFEEVTSSPTPSPPTTPPPNDALAARSHPRSPQSNVCILTACPNS